jgi:uncharacterized protein (TIGR02611 family)
MRKAPAQPLPAGGRRLPRLFLRTLKNAKRAIVGVIGVTVLAVGIAMIVLPGPAVIVIPLGLGILATEFAWAHSLLCSLKTRATRLKKGSPCPANP